ncbi:MAG: hypothetical protein JJT81_03520 [Rubellimicrobium sp.]|nr:hypothetical protein [Rubellimicrobium sp.]
MTGDDLAAFLALLEAERRALMIADFGSLQQLEPEKTALLDRLLRNGIEPGSAEALLQAVRRNDMLLRAALDGLRSAILRLSELKDLRTGFQGYSPDGHVARHAVATSRLARKA